jgi:hypothetical protein
MAPFKTTKIFGVDIHVLGKYVFIGFLLTYLGASFIPATIMVSVGDQVGSKLTGHIWKVK